MAILCFASRSFLGEIFTTEKLGFCTILLCPRQLSTTRSSPPCLIIDSLSCGLRIHKGFSFLFCQALPARFLLGRFPLSACSKPSESSTPEEQKPINTEREREICPPPPSPTSVSTKQEQTQPLPKPLVRDTSPSSVSTKQEQTQPLPHPLMGDSPGEDPGSHGFGACWRSHAAGWEFGPPTKGFTTSPFLR